MKLSDFKTSENIKLLLCGPPGSAKTCAAVGFPYPMLVFDFDGKINSAAAWYSEDKARLAGIEVKSFSRRLDGSDPVVELLAEVKELGEQQKRGEMKYKTLVIDSATTFSSAVLNHIVKTNPGVKRPSSAQGVQPTPQDYGVLKREFAKLIPGLLSLPMNVVMTAHVKTDRSEVTGEILRSPIMDGSFAQELPIFFEEVYRTYMKDGKPWAQTKADLDYNFCRSQIPRLPNPMELRYDELIKKR